MMVTLLLYAYCLGERSSRRIEHLCERDIGFRMKAGLEKEKAAVLVALAGLTNGRKAIVAM